MFSASANWRTEALRSRSTCLELVSMASRAGLSR